MWDVRDLRSYWRDFPPLHVIEAAKLGLGGQRKRKGLSPATLAAFGGVKVKRKE
jgi:hypothetical protein